MYIISEERHIDDGPPTEEIYLELRGLESGSATAKDTAAIAEPAPVLADDDPHGTKARIARLRAILTDRGAEPPS